MTDEAGGVVFERRLGRRRGAALGALLLGSLLLPLLGRGAERLAVSLAEALTFAYAPAVGELTALLLFVSPVLVFVAALSWATRRFGRAVVAADHVAITPLGLFERGGAVIPLQDLVGRKDTPHGLLLDAPLTFDRLTRLLFPPLIPAHDAAELARVHALLDAPAVEPPPGVPTAVAGHGLMAGELLGVGVALGPPGASVFILHDLAGWPAGAGGAMLFCAGALVVLSLLPRRLRVQMGITHVSLGRTRVAWSALRQVHVDGAALHLELADGRRRTARPGTAAVAELAAVARARRPPGAVVEGRPAWARRRRRLLTGGVVALALVGLWLGPVRALTLEGCVGLQDHHGYRARVIYRGVDPSPRLVVVVDPPSPPPSPPSSPSLRLRAGGLLARVFQDPGADGAAHIDVDLRAGRVRTHGLEHAVPSDATFVHVRRDGVRWSTRALPRVEVVGAVGPPPAQVVPVSSRLEVVRFWLPDDDPVVRDLLDGRTATRCLDATSSRLLLRVAEGALSTLVVLDPGAQLPAAARAATCPVCALNAEHAGRLVRVTAGGELLAADLPTFDDALVAFQEVCEGRPVEEATAGFAGGLWSRPVPGGR